MMISDLLWIYLAIAILSWGSMALYINYHWVEIREEYKEDTPNFYDSFGEVGTWLVIMGWTLLRVGILWPWALYELVRDMRVFITFETTDDSSES